MDVWTTAYDLGRQYGLLIVAAILLTALWAAGRAAASRSAKTWGLTGVFVTLALAGFVAYLLLSPFLGAAMIVLGSVLAVVSAARPRRV